MNPGEADFSEYVTVRWDRLVKAAMLMGCTSSEAEDLVQTTLETALRKWSFVRNVENIDAYVHRMLFNHLSSSKRSARAKREIVTETLNPPLVGDHADQVVRQELILVALRKLPTEQRAVVVLRFLEFFSEAETAEILQVPKGTVKSRVHRALKALESDVAIQSTRRLT